MNCSRFIVLNLLLSSLSFASDKVYTQEDFDKKLKDKLNKEVERIKKKSIADLTKEVLERERELDKRSDQLDKRAEQIQMSEQSFAQKVLRFEEEQKRFLGCIDEKSKSEGARIKQLVSVISNMKPDKAADLLSVQDTQISVKILELIQPEKASRIFNLMDKEVSARLQKQYLNMQK